MKFSDNFFCNVMTPRHINLFAKVRFHRAPVSNSKTSMYLCMCWEWTTKSLDAHSNKPNSTFLKGKLTDKGKKHALTIHVHAMIDCSLESPLGMKLNNVMKIQWLQTETATDVE